QQQVTAARNQTAAAQQAARSQLQNAQGQLRTARAALQNAGAQGLLANRHREAARAAARQTTELIGLRTKLLLTAAAFAAAVGFRRFIQEGLKFNDIMETAQLGIASLISAAGALSTAQGRVLSGNEALNASFVM